MHMNTRTYPITNAIACWGAEAQKSMFYEEMGEVLTAISHEKRGRCGREAVLQELADLQIMLNQMTLLYGTDEEFHNAYGAKMDRLVDKIKRHQL